MKKTLNVEIETPAIPEYLRYGNDKFIPIEDFTDEELKKIAAEWTKNLIAAAKRKRKTQTP